MRMNIAHVVCTEHSHKDWARVGPIAALGIMQFALAYTHQFQIKAHISHNISVMQDSTAD